MLQRRLWPQIPLAASTRQYSALIILFISALAANFFNYLVLYSAMLLIA